MSFLYWREDDPDYDGNEVIVRCPQCGKPAKDWGTLIWCREGEHLTAQVSYELEVCPTSVNPTKGIRPRLRHLLRPKFYPT